MDGERRYLGSMPTSAREKSDSRMLLLLGMVIFLVLGIVFCRSYDQHLNDFRAIYYPTRGLLAHRDPYSRAAVNQVYEEQGGKSLDPVGANNQIAMQTDYPPTVFPFAAPFAMLPWRTAEVAFLIVDLGAFLLACGLVWSAASAFSPEAAGFLFLLLLINWESLIVYGNVGGMVASLSAIAAWCFVKNRAVAAGVVCLGLALALKPHESGQVWLCLLLLGGAYRRRALQSLLVLAAVGLPGALWAWHLSPHWLAEMFANIGVYAHRGGINDPGPQSGGGRGIDMLVNLQTALSAVKDDARFYNAATYLVCAPLIAFWGWLCLRMKPTARNAWFALAAIAPLSMLPVYHRQLDAVLVMLSIPACAILWKERAPAGRLALGVTAFSFCAMGFIFWGVVYHFVAEHKIQGEARILVGTIPVPLVLLAMSVLFLWVQGKQQAAEAEAAAAG